MNQYNSVDLAGRTQKLLRWNGQNVATWWAGQCIIFLGALQVLLGEGQVYSWRERCLLKGRVGILSISGADRVGFLGAIGFKFQNVSGFELVSTCFSSGISHCWIGVCSGKGGWFLTVGLYTNYVYYVWFCEYILCIIFTMQGSSKSSYQMYIMQQLWIDLDFLHQNKLSFQFPMNFYQSMLNNTYVNILESAKRAPKFLKAFKDHWTGKTPWLGWIHLILTAGPVFFLRFI